ncbi:MAG: hypothetical protein Q4B60_08105 [Erysipelotrichaceae bacterium]|nr:hypothetical protein [Erysipelotrichaceae bacterium]
MNIFSRDFTLREKFTIGLLFALIIGICYSQFIDKPIKRSIANSEAQIDSLNTELMITNMKIQSLQMMKDELETILNDPNITVMPSYNAVKSELSFLNDILSMSKTYNITLADVTRDSDQIRRDVAISFTADSYEQAKTIIEALSASKDRCLISNVSISNGNGVSVNLQLTFYETMVGGVADTGLPN